MIIWVNNGDEIITRDGLRYCVRLDTLHLIKDETPPPTTGLTLTVNESGQRIVASLERVVSSLERLERAIRNR